jgi:ketosteroid isomerase-like protein
MSCRSVGASVDGLEHVEDVLARWIDAEARGDAAALDALLADEFCGDGPRGYVLGKEQWLDRYRRGELTNDAFAWHDTDVRVHEDTAVIMGVQAQTACYQGHDCSGRFRATLVAVRHDGRWSIVNLQVSTRVDLPR